MPTDTPPLVSVPTARRDRIVVSGLIVDAFVGVHSFERLERQRLRFDIEVDTVDGYAQTVRSTGRFVSYADIVDFIEQRAALDTHVDLVETWAEDVAGFVVRHELVDAVRVCVTKPDIFDGADGVGISIERRRGPTTAGAGT